MKYLYYPGCTLKTKAKLLDYYALRALEALFVDVTVFDEWQCCGAVYPAVADDIAGRLSAVRALETARRMGCELLTLCSACHHVLKRVNRDMAENADIATKVNNYSQFEAPYLGETKVVHFMELLRDVLGFERLSELVVNPLSGRSIGAYYGCLLLRPGGVMEFDDPENPSVMEDFLRAIGADVVTYSYRNECCGGYLALDDSELVRGLCASVLGSSREKGAEALVTACPLCSYNITKNSDDDSPRVFYFTELLAEALGVK